MIKTDIPEGLVVSSVTLRDGVSGISYNVNGLPGMWWVYVHVGTDRGVIRSSELDMASLEDAIAWCADDYERRQREEPGALIAQDVDANGAPVESAP